jgi:hypothetical protein
MHPYLRAYLAGIALPTMLVPLVLLGLSLRGPSGHAFHIEDVLIFPIGLVPNAWGLWNMFYVWVRRRREIGAGPYGACLAVLLAPAAFGLQVALGKVIWTPALFAIGFPVALVAYYLAWKFVVGRLNDALGIG